MLVDKLCKKVCEYVKDRSPAQEFRPRRALISVLLVLLAACPGCGETKPSLTQVKGQVVVKGTGKPVPAHSIQFESKEPPYTRALGLMDADGRFEMVSENREAGGVVKGKHRVRLGTTDDTGMEIKQLFNVVDRKYADFGSSQLEVEIVEGQDHDLKLELDPPAKK